MTHTLFNRLRLCQNGVACGAWRYRRLLPLLEAQGIEAYAPCVAGWGFTDTSNLRGVGVNVKREQLLAFHEYAHLPQRSTKCAIEGRDTTKQTLQHPSVHCIEKSLYTFKSYFVAEWCGNCCLQSLGLWSSKRCHVFLHTICFSFGVNGCCFQALGLPSSRRCRDFGHTV